MTAPRQFTLDHAEHVALGDGTPIVIRLLAPGDKALLRTGFERLSAESRYTRFLAPKTTLTDDELRYLTEVDQETHVALGAIRDDPDEVAPVGLGIARFIRIADLPADAEAAITVADEVQGRGLGRLLLLRLCAAAVERGIERFHCEVLASNTAMVALLEQIAPDRTIEVGDGVMSIVMAVPSVSPAAATDPPPLGPMYRLFRAAAENTIEWTEAVRRLWRRP